MSIDDGNTVKYLLEKIVLLKKEIHLLKEILRSYLPIIERKNN